MYIKFILIVFFTLPTTLGIAQNSAKHNHEDHDHSKAHIHKNEVGISFAPVYFLNAGEWSMAAHLHYVYNFPETNFGLGLGYERIFDKHKHNFVGVELNYRPIHSLTFNVSPGVAFEGAEKGSKYFAFHFETGYEFEFGKFHVGPMVEFAYHREDYHLSFGLHVGAGW